MRINYIVIILLFILMVPGVFAQRVASKPQAVRTITVLSEPEASVWLDGLLRGVTDSSGKLLIKPVARGPRAIKVRANGFKQITRTVGAAENSIQLGLVKTFDRAELAFQSAEQKMSEDKDEAITLYKEALRLSPRYSDAIIGLARAYAETGDYVDGLALVKKTRQSKLVLPELTAVEGRIYRSSGDIDKAIESFENAIREGKGFQPEAHTGLGLIFKDEAESARSRGDFEEEKLYYEEAAKSMETAIDQLSATEPVIYLLLGDIYEKSHEKAKAIKIYKKFLTDLPDHEERTAVESFIVQLNKPDII